MVDSASSSITLTKVGDLARRGSAWWLTELGSLVPDRVSQAWSRDPRRILITQDATGFRLLLDRGGEFHELARESSIDAVETLVREVRRRWGPLLSVWLLVAREQCLLRHKAIPKAALLQSHQIMAADLLQATPFREEDVYWGLCNATSPSTGPGEVALQQIILKRNLVDKILAGAPRLRESLTGIGVLDHENRMFAVNLLPMHDRKTMLERVLRQGIAVLASVLLLVMLLTAAASIYRYDEAHRAVELEIEQAMREATRVRKQIAEADTFLSRVQEPQLRRLTEKTTVEVWEDVSQLLPITDWLASLRIEAGAVYLDGYARTASELVGLFSRSGKFKDVAFSSPVMRDGQLGMERFQLKMQIVNSAAADQSGSPRP